jgi:hypothetical protein
MTLGMYVGLLGILGAQAGISILLFQIGSDLWNQSDAHHKELIDEIRKLKEKE